MLTTPLSLMSSVICKFAEGALDHHVYMSLMMILNSTGPSMDP